MNALSRLLALSDAQMLLRQSRRLQLFRSAESATGYPEISTASVISLIRVKMMKRRIVVGIKTSTGISVTIDLFNEKCMNDLPIPGTDRLRWRCISQIGMHSWI